MKKFTLLVITAIFMQSALAEVTWDCYVKVTNPEENNMVLANQCIDFPDDMSESTYKSAKGLCEPEWDGMNVDVSYTAKCGMPTLGKCQYVFPVPELNFKYTVFQYSAYMLTLEDSERSCREGGGKWSLY